MPGGHFDEKIAFLSLRTAILTISDTRDDESDTSGALLAKRVAVAGHLVARRALVKDEKNAIQSLVRAWILDPEIQVIIATGGTGLTTRDVTPEAFRELFEKELEGFQVVWHLVSYESVGVSTLQSRACAGIAGGTVLFALPGSNGACEDGWDKIIGPLLDSRHRPCSLTEILPRLAQ